MYLRWSHLFYSDFRSLVKYLVLRASFRQSHFKKVSKLEIRKAQFKLLHHWGTASNSAKVHHFYEFFPANKTEMDQQLFCQKDCTKISGVPDKDILGQPICTLIDTELGSHPTKNYQNLLVPRQPDLLA